MKPMINIVMLTRKMDLENLNFFEAYLKYSDINNSEEVIIAYQYLKRLGWLENYSLKSDYKSHNYYGL